MPIYLDVVARNGHVPSGPVDPAVFQRVVVGHELGACGIHPSGFGTLVAHHVVAHLQALAPSINSGTHGVVRIVVADLDPSTEVFGA